ncbi:MAG: hypothetical protein ACI80S_001811 [Pseudohongiellaceae bacterium]|jgi:hypothetical protein
MALALDRGVVPQHPSIHGYCWGVLSLLSVAGRELIYLVPTAAFVVVLSPTAPPSVYIQSNISPETLVGI